MKVKIFEKRYEIEKQIQKWLDENKNITIISCCMSEGGGLDHIFRLLIIYKE